MVESKITFKQYLLQEQNLDWAAKYPRYTREQIEQMPTMNAQNIGGKFRVGNIVFDQQNGIGSVPWNQEVGYKGFVAMMRPGAFRAFTLPMEESRERIDKYKLLFQQGIATGSPWLQLDVDSPTAEKAGKFRIVGHEGRARTAAIAELQPNIEIPVHVFIYQGNHKDLKPEMISRLNTSIMKEQSSIVVSNKISSILFQGQWIKL